MKRSMACIICPRGCALEIDLENLTVTGNTCPRGEAYARQEVTCPMRTLTTALRVANRENTMVSVKTAAPIPREKLMDAMEVLKALPVKAPITLGQVLLEDLYGAQVVATSNVESGHT